MSSGFARWSDREGAAGLRDAYLEATAAELPGATYYWHEIVGCEVSDSRGRVLGRVEEVFRVGESEVYVVRGGAAELLVPDGAEFYGQLSCLKAGIRYADRLTTVSPTYAREILTSEYGAGMDGLLRNRVGIEQRGVNGPRCGFVAQHTGYAVKHSFQVQ